MRALVVLALLHCCLSGCGQPAQSSAEQLALRVKGKPQARAIDVTASSGSPQSPQTPNPEEPAVSASDPVRLQLAEPPEDFNPLELAHYHKENDLSTALYKGWVDINALYPVPDSTLKHTLLHEACLKAGKSRIEDLLRRGADPNVKDSRGLTPFERYIDRMADADRSGKDQLVATLGMFAEHGMKLTLQEDEEGRNILHRLLSHHVKAHAFFAICDSSPNFDPNHLDETGTSLLLYAMRETKDEDRELQLVEGLLERGAYLDLEIRPKFDGSGQPISGIPGSWSYQNMLKASAEPKTRKFLDSEFQRIGKPEDKHPEVLGPAYSISGVLPGMSREEVEAVAGPPTGEDQIMNWKVEAIHSQSTARTICEDVLSGKVDSSRVRVANPAKMEIFHRKLVDAKVKLSLERHKDLALTALDKNSCEIRFQPGLPTPSEFFEMAGVSIKAGVKVFLLLWSEEDGQPIRLLSEGSSGTSLCGGVYELREIRQLVVYQQGMVQVDYQNGKAVKVYGTKVYLGGGNYLDVIDQSEPGWKSQGPNPRTADTALVTSWGKSKPGKVHDREHYQIQAFYSGNTFDPRLGLKSWFGVYPD